MTEFEALAREAHFTAMTQSTEPIRLYSLANREPYTAALRGILYHIADEKRKFRLVVDYDPEFPLIDVKMFALD